ncbi:C1 family peptidase [Siphonobacter sp. SORGH_AS_0500]|uniref:C1 family peptidase n=1 Tax=Siphonobacter sp. SORGH_AS_0500 TaxID=1864824 RepID=UPI002866FE5E|nr:C1 family peptidase [Siphonobacter sp. SORGH_AS_0500]MDR6197253.1 C1A family cysteine protease [Siphonobacter sp. SORGH_AS_0500]
MRGLGIVLAGFILLLSGNIEAQPLPQTGMLLDDEAYEHLPFEPVLTKAPLPAQVSFEAYCPSVQGQGTYSTCVGFACGYYLHTILEAKKRGLKNQVAINKLAFSPGYLYEKAKLGSDYDCSQGVYLTKVLQLMQEVGNTSWQNFPYPACGEKTARVDPIANRYRIKGYERIFKVQDSEAAKIQALKRALSEGNPVVVGMVIPASFYYTKKVWQAAPGDDPQNRDLKGHALCIIGYDDQQSGGAFRIINSFGKTWADQGFCWITYRDMARFVRYGFVVKGI